MRHGSPIRERDLDGRIKFRIREVNQLEAGSGLSIAGLFAAALPMSQRNRYRARDSIKLTIPSDIRRVADHQTKLIRRIPSINYSQFPVRTKLPLQDLLSLRDLTVLIISRERNVLAIHILHPRTNPVQNMSCNTFGNTTNNRENHFVYCTARSALCNRPRVSYRVSVGSVNGLKK